MSDIESAQQSKNHENQDILPDETKSLDIIIDITKDSKVEALNQKVIEINVPTNKVAEHVLRGVHSTVLDVNNMIDTDIEKQNVKDSNKNNEKPLENVTYITMTVYDTHHEQKQPKEEPNREKQIERSSLHRPSRNEWSDGGHYGQSYDPRTRNSFVKLVFGILLIMIVLASGVIFFIIREDELKYIFYRYQLIIFIISTIIACTCHYAMFCTQCARVLPCNIVILTVTVIAYSLLAANISVRYRTHLVLYAALATAAVVFVCLLLACTSFDFTSWMIYVVVFATVFSIITAIIFVGGLVTGGYPKPLHIVVLIIGTLLQVVILIMELQNILGGKAIELNEDDYALGAFMLFTSIASLFMQLLQLFGMSE